MEGKGIGNSGFYEGAEWFTIRGISDYGDRHVTPLWRKYASLAAAAYADAARNDFLRGRLQSR